MTLAPTAVEPAVAGIAIFAHDPAALVDVYTSLLGRSFDLRVHADGREHWILPLGGVQLEVKALQTARGEAASDAVGDEQQAGATSRTELSLKVADAEAAFSRALELGCTAHQAPEQFAWGTFGTVVDPEGNRLGLFTPHTTEGTA